MAKATKTLAAAAALWDQLEREMADMGLQPEKLLVKRAVMIRTIHEAMKRRRPVEVTEVMGATFPLVQPVETLPARLARSTTPSVDAQITKRLNELLERSSGLHGYEIDDQVK